MLNSFWSRKVFWLFFVFLVKMFSGEVCKIMARTVSTGILLAVIFTGVNTTSRKHQGTKKYVWKRSSGCSFDSDELSKLHGFVLLPQQTESVLAGSLPLRRTSFSLFSLCFSSFSWTFRSSLSFFLIVERSLWLETPSAWRIKCRELERSSTQRPKH